MSGPTIVMTPGTYKRKTAYQIDPLLNAAVVIEQPHNPRGEEDKYSTEAGEHRTDFFGDRFWQPDEKRKVNR